MLMSMLEKPDQFTEHIQRYNNSLSTQIVYGHRTLTADDPALIQLFKQVINWSKVNGRSFAALPDIFPLLQWLPDTLLPIKRHAKDFREAENAYYCGLWDTVKDNIKAGVALVRSGSLCWSFPFFLPKTDMVP